MVENGFFFWGTPYLWHGVLLGAFVVDMCAACVISMEDSLWSYGCWSMQSLGRVLLRCVLADLEGKNWRKCCVRERERD